MDLTAAAKTRFKELNKLMELRDGAYENTRIYKEITKKWHDSRLRGDKDFKIGDKVLFNSRLSKGYKLPPSYYVIKKIFKRIGLGYESIHAYKHDCYLFWGDDNKDLDLCPMCNMSRWKDSNTSGKKVPKKVLRYFSIIPRLQRLYKSSHTAKEMIWHATGKCTESGKIQHPVNGRAWKNFDTNMWPVILTTYNQPMGLCTKESSFMLTLLISGPNSLGKDIDVYLRPLIEDLKVLWDRKGVKTIDVASCQKFNMRAMVLWTINDFLLRVVCMSEVGKALEGRPICPRWMFPFERYMKKLKGYVRNKAKLEGSITEGYVVEEALTFSSHYFRDVTKKFNRPERNVDPPPPTCQFQVFRFVCKLTGLWSVIRFDAQELKNMKWYVLHNSPEIDTYWSQFKRGVIVVEDDPDPDLSEAAHGIPQLDRDQRRPYNVEKIRRVRPKNITASEWDKYIEFWNDPRNIARAVQNRQNRAKSTVISRQGSRSLARLQDEMTSTTQEYPSLIDTFFVVHTVNGEFLQDGDLRIYVNDDDDDDDEVDLRSGPAVRGKLLRALTMALTFFESTSGALVDTGREQTKHVVHNGKKETTTLLFGWIAGANTVGEQPHTDEASRSDLDGDLYFLTWDDHLIPPSKQSWPPMEYTADEAKELPRESSQSANDQKQNGRTTLIEKARLLLFNKALMRMSSDTKRLRQNNGNTKRRKMMEKHVTTVEQIGCPSGGVLYVSKIFVIPVCLDSVHTDIMQWGEF
nr:hypothetical protein [Tanacetum cinerariifolium]